MEGCRGGERENSLKREGRLLQFFRAERQRGKYPRITYESDLCENERKQMVAFRGDLPLSPSPPLPPQNQLGSLALIETEMAPSTSQISSPSSPSSCEAVPDTHLFCMAWELTPTWFLGEPCTQTEMRNCCLQQRRSYPYPGLLGPSPFSQRRISERSS